MAEVGKWFLQAKKRFYKKEVDWEGDTIKVMLCTSSYTPDQVNHDYKNDITNEITGTGYTSGGQTIANRVVTMDTANKKAILDGDDNSWGPSATITARYAVLYKDTGDAATSPLIGYVDMGADVECSEGTFLIQWNTAGILDDTIA